MPRQNRVTPFGELVAASARGTLMGNRGCLHDAGGIIRRTYQGKRWIICLLDFKGRHQQIMAPGRYTQLFFLDEATALAAGHRPCAECQSDRFELFRTAWLRGNPDLAPLGRPTANQIDAALHAERITGERQQVTYPAGLDELPDGCFVRLDGDESAYLVAGRRLLRWSPRGYNRAVPRAPNLTVAVLTPRSIVRALAAGYAAHLHETAYTVPGGEE